MAEEYLFEAGREVGVQWGERAERERIIKLLEELKNQMLALQQPGHKDLTGNMAIRAKGVEIAIDTIKGENK